MSNRFTNLRRGLALAVLFATGSLAAQAQGVGIGTSAPLAGLHVDTPESTSTTALGVITSGGTSGSPSIELRGSGKSPYIDFAETSGVDYTTRLSSSSGTLNVKNADATVPALNVYGYTKLSGATAGPAIAMVKLVGIIPPISNLYSVINLPAGITQDKVLSLTGMAIGRAGGRGTSLYPPNNGVGTTTTNASYQLYLSGNQIFISTYSNPGGSDDVSSSTVNILIIYEQ